jgi:hypothetical protein
MSRGAKAALVAGGLIIGAGLAWGVWNSMRDYGSLFLQRKGTLLQARRELVATTAQTSLYELHLTSDTGLEVDARLRVPVQPGRYPALLIAAGLHTGQHVIDLVEEQDKLVLMAIDYGWKGEFALSTLPNTVRTFWRLRAVSNDAVPRMLLALDALVREPASDPARTVVLGVSYGSYHALATAALDPRVSRIILLQGGGEIGPVIAANAPLWKSPLPPGPTGWVGKTLLTAFEPARWIGRVAPRRVTFIASRHDPQFPVASVERVFAQAGEPKELVWHDTPHVGPNAAEIIHELTQVVLQQLGAE